MRRYLWLLAPYAAVVLTLRWLRLRESMTWGDVVEIVLAGLFFAWLFQRLGPGAGSRVGPADERATWI